MAKPRLLSSTKRTPAVETVPFLPPAFREALEERLGIIDTPVALAGHVMRLEACNLFRHIELPVFRKRADIAGVNRRGRVALELLIHVRDLLVVNTKVTRVAFALFSDCRSPLLHSGTLS
jgi:hypothetical protein